MCKTIGIALIGCLLVLGCDDKKEGGGGKEAAAGGSVSLAKLGLKADAPDGSRVSDAVMGDGVMIQGPNLVVTVEVASESKPKTIEDAKKDAEMFSPQNVQTEKLADGWAFSFENKGSAGTNYFVKVRREIGGKAYWCETIASNPDQKANALKACKSLKK
jgi:hypothetical protein